MGRQPSDKQQGPTRVVIDRDSAAGDNRGHKHACNWLHMDKGAMELWAGMAREHGKKSLQLSSNHGGQI